MNQATPETERYHLEAGRLCLDFANTVEWHASDHPEEYLHSYADLVAWAEHTGILTTAEAQRLIHQAVQHPAETATTFEDAIVLRETIYRIFAAAAHGRRPEQADLVRLNGALSGALIHVRIAQAAEGFEWTWDTSEGAPDRMLWPVGWSAATLLTSGDLTRVGQCADEHGCGWLFFDTSRNHSRRWCGMDGCGNRAKARRHYERARSARPIIED